MVDDETMKLGIVFQLPPKMGDLLGLLLAMPTVTNKMIRQRVTPKPKAAIFRLRQLLPGVEIHSRRYVGYWIEDKDKARIRAAVTAKMENV